MRHANRAMIMLAVFILAGCGSAPEAGSGGVTGFAVRSSTTSYGLWAMTYDYIVHQRGLTVERINRLIDRNQGLSE